MSYCCLHNKLHVIQPSETFPHKPGYLHTMLVQLDLKQKQKEKNILTAGFYFFPL